MNDAMRVLIVDDEKTYRDFLAEFFREWGFMVEVGCDSSIAFKAANRHKPQLLVTDWLLQDKLTGFDVAIKLKEDIPDLRVLVITGLPNIHIDRSLSWIKVLAKPFREVQLKELVFDLVGGSSCKCERTNSERNEN